MIMSKIIIVPINKEAELKLDYDTASPNELIEIRLNESEFNILWKKGVFDLINQTCNSIIDDDEYEKINNLTLIESTCNQLNKTFPECKNIINIFHKALELKTSIHFYF